MHGYILLIVVAVVWCIGHGSGGGCSGGGSVDSTGGSGTSSGVMRCTGWWSWWR